MEDEESGHSLDTKSNRESKRTSSLHTFRVCCKKSNSKKCTNCQNKPISRLDEKIFIHSAFKSGEISEDLEHNENIESEHIENKKNVLIISKATKSVDLKPVLKFSVSAILGSDHGKPAFRSGKRKF